MGTDKKPQNPNAFPTMEHGYDKTGCPTVNTYEGMTLRDYFAAKAMQGSVVSDGPEFPTPELIAKWSYAVADAMLRQREL